MTAPLAPAGAAHRGPLERARDEYLYMASVAPYHPRGCLWCLRRGGPTDNHWWLLVDAASIEYDLAVALHFAGRHPMIASRREIAW